MPLICSSIDVQTNAPQFHANNRGRIGTNSSNSLISFDSAMIQAARILAFLANFAYYAVQAAAIAAGLNAWLGWQSTWALAISLVVLWNIPIPFAVGIASILGAHYGWQWSWLTSILLFVGTALLVTAIQASVLGGAGSFPSRWLDLLAGKPMTPSGHDHSNTASTASDCLTIVRKAMYCIALVILSGLLITEAVRFVIPSQPSNMASAMPAKLDPQFKASLEKIRVRLNSTPEFMALLRTMTPQEAVAKGVELAHHGLMKLSVPDLERWANINLLMLNSADPSACARFARPTAKDPEQIAISRYVLLVQQSPAVIDDWLDLVYRAIFASLQQQPDHRPSQREIDAAMQRILTLLPEAQQKAIRLFVETPSKATDEQLCAGLKALTSASVAAPAPDRAVLVRALALR